MKTMMVGLLVIAGACGFGSRSFVQDENTERLIRIEVHVRDFRGTPIDRVLLGVFDGTTTRVDGATDEDGNVTFELELPKDVTRVEIKSAWASKSSFTPQEQNELARDMRARVKEYAAWDRCYIDLEPRKRVYRTEIVFPEAVIVSGIVVGENDEPIGNIVYARNAGLADAKGRRRFQLSNVRKGVDTTLLASFHVSGSLTPLVPIHLTARQTNSNVDLGLLVMPDINRDGALDVYLSNHDVIPRTRIGVTFIQIDGKVLFAVRAYGAIDSERERIGEAIGNPIELPAGTYYVAPGNVLGSPLEEVWALVEALHQGRDVDKFGVHKITIEKDEQQTFHFDLAELQKPIREMMKAVEAKDE